jgi:hypothetical protein
MRRVVSLRRHQDVISLVASWALLLQALIGPVLPSLYTTADEGVVMCTTKGVAAEDAPLPKPHKPNCECCTLICRAGCGNMSTGVLPSAIAVLPSGAAAIFIPGPRLDAPTLRQADLSAARPRGPPIA